MRFDDFFYQLSIDERKAFAEQTPYSYDYIRMRLAVYSWRRTKPRRYKFDTLVQACNSFLRVYGPAKVPSRAQLEAFFYGGQVDPKPPNRRMYRGPLVAGTLRRKREESAAGG